MKKLLKIGLVLFLFGIVAAVGTYFYVFHKPHRNIAKEVPAYVVCAKKLYTEFSEDEIIAYVLSDFTPDEKQAITQVIPRVSEAILCLLTEGLAKTMNKYN